MAGLNRQDVQIGLCWATRWSSTRATNERDAFFVDDAQRAHIEAHSDDLGAVVSAASQHAVAGQS